MLELSRERTAGALPYLAPPEHTARARRILGSALLVAEQKLVLDDDPQRAREVGRQTVDMYLGLRNYVSNLRRLGFSEDDVAKPGSDRLIDVLTVHGTPVEVTGQLVEHLKAGADHVALQALDADYLGSLRQLAPLLTAAD
ncbi:hypothetical protein [Nocardia sp. NPDC004260]